MANDIKIDRETIPSNQITIEKNHMHSNHNKHSVEGVSVSTHLSHLANQMEPEGEVQSGASVADIKQQIQSGQYSIDYHALSENLLNSGVLSRT